jgi:hypothetical protein
MNLKPSAHPARPHSVALTNALPLAQRAPPDASPLVLPLPQPLVLPLPQPLALPLPQPLALPAAAGAAPVRCLCPSPLRTTRAQRSPANQTPNGSRMSANSWPVASRAR